MTADITKAKATWKSANHTLLKLRADHGLEPTPTSRKALVAAADQWQAAAAAWSAAIKANGNSRADRAEYVAATWVSLSGGRPRRPVRDGGAR